MGGSDPPELKASLHATSLSRTANYLDTLACAYALGSDFASATRNEGEAISLEPKPEFSFGTCHLMTHHLRARKATTTSSKILATISLRVVSFGRW